MSRSRQGPRGIGPPPEDLPEIPSERLRDAQLWRIHRASVDPLQPANGPHGRFNLDRPRGTLYAGASPLAAFVEVFGRLAIVDQREAANYRLTELRSGDLRIADVTARKVLGRAGLTAEIHSTVDYELTRSWARALAGAGFDGIRYLARHDPSARLDSIGLFADKGQFDLTVVATTALPADLIETAETEFGLLIAPRRLRRR